MVEAIPKSASGTEPTQDSMRAGTLALRQTTSFDATRDAETTADPRRIESLAARYQLVMPDHHRSSIQGDLAGRRTGSSIEYQDRKDYVPGDDLRHLDWRAFARSDRLTVKLYREEITPRVDLLADASLSMAVTAAKRRLRDNVTHLLYSLARRVHAVVTLSSVGERLDPLNDPLALRAVEESRQTTPLPLLQSAPGARGGGVKIFVSDFLFPFEPAELVRAFPRADRLVLVQVVSAFEDDPESGGEVRLEDAESADYLDLALDHATVAGYKRRLGALREELARRLRTVRGAMAVVRDDEPIETAARRLLEAGIIEA
jgi:uncharacterized protein (DUF58 family)